MLSHDRLQVVDVVAVLQSTRHAPHHFRNLWRGAGKQPHQHHFVCQRVRREGGEESFDNPAATPQKVQNNQSSQDEEEQPARCWTLVRMYCMIDRLGRTQQPGNVQANRPRRTHSEPGVPRVPTTQDPTSSTQQQWERQQRHGKHDAVTQFTLGTSRLINAPPCEGCNTSSGASHRSTREQQKHAGRGCRITSTETTYDSHERKKKKYNVQGETI